MFFEDAKKEAKVSKIPNNFGFPFFNNDKYDVLGDKSIIVLYSFNRL